MSPRIPVQLPVLALLLACCLLYSTTSAQRPEARLETMTYKRVGGRELQVDVFWPPAMSNDVSESSDSALPHFRRPAIAFFHGGGWVGGDRSVYHEACRRYADRGFVTCTFQYRLSRNEDGTYPHPEITPVESVQDARSALRWMRRRADTLGIDPQRIAAWGRSAGGQLVLATAICDGIDDPRDNRTISPVPNALLTFSACYNTVQTWCDRMLGEKRDRIWDISPHHGLTANLPPSIGFHGLKDTTEPVRVARWFQAKARTLGCPFELVILKDQGHHLAGGGDLPGEIENDVIMKRVDAFLRQTGLMPVE